MLGMTDPRIQIPREVRNAGLFIGVLLMIAGLIVGWIRSGHPIQYSATGGGPK
jgi:hypothetical protein